MDWTAQQEAAINDNGGALLVSAAAGSGKTAVLVERAVRLMLDEKNPIAADRILIVTFTRAAAEELRGRIGARLAAEQAVNPKSLNIRRQRLLLGRASISTIDAFCMQLLKQYFAELSIPPDFDKADEALVSTLRADACAEMLEEMYQNDAFCALAAMYGRSRSDNSVSEAVLKVYDFLRSAALPRAMAQSIEKMWTSPAPLCESEWGKELFMQASLTAQSALDLACRAKEIAIENELLHYIPVLDSDIAAIELMLKPIYDNNWNAAYVAAHSYKAEALRGKKGIEGDEVDAIKLLREKIKKTILKLREGVFVCTQEEHSQDIEQAAPMVSALLFAAQRFEDTFYAKKLAEKVLEYSDFEHLARILLCDESGQKTKAAQALSAQFDAVMIDEFQDTNALQALLYACLANEDGSNLFMVGDVKQSIYRFRLAEPAIFVSKKDSYVKHGEGYPAVITLGHNFRSSQSVVDQINYFFAQLMSRELGGVNYTAEERLVAGKGARAFGEGALIKIIDTAKGKVEAADAPEIARTIEEMLQSGQTVKDGDAMRPCRHGDFCILLRTRSSILQYAAALEARGIPCVADTTDDTLLSPEIGPLLSLLRIIDNPGQDIHMAAVLLSPLYSFKPDTLLALREKGKSLYAVLSAHKGERERAVSADVRYFRAVCASAPFSEVIDAIMARTSYFSAVSAMPEGAIRRENLRAFIAYAVNACSVMGGISAFLRRIDASSGVLAEMDNAVKASHGAVSIMTVHKSKGLEFPICILANTQHKFNQSGYVSNILLNPRLGLGLSLKALNGGLYTTLPLRALALSERRESVSEEMRVLYVALTRAKDCLIITMATKDSTSFLEGLALPLLCGGKAKQALLNSATDMGSWLCAAALLHPMGKALRNIKMGTLLPIEIAEKSELSAIIVSAQQQEAKLQIVKQAAKKADEQLQDELEKGFERSRQLLKKESLPVKISVSALSKADREQALSRPSFMYEQGLTAAEKGTAMHSVLQFIDFKQAKKCLEQELERLQKNGFIAPQLLQRLDNCAIGKFLQSELLARLVSADKVMREYDFIADFKDEENIDASILVQGIADLVIIRDNSIEIADYKTDRGKAPQQLIAQYQKQLHLYAGAISRRLSLSVTRLTIYSFALEKEIDVPLP